MKKTVLVAMAALMAVASYAQKKSASESVGTKSLVLYYSQTGATKAVADELKVQLGADIDSIVAENPYLGTFEETMKRCQQEMAGSVLPTLKPLNADIAKYDTIYLGYPVWFGTFARPMISYLKNTSLEGKVVIPFCTFGSGGLTETTAELKKVQPNATIMEGYGVRNARIDAIPEEVERFLKENHYIDGKIESIPPYSEQKAVTDNEKQIFEQACGDYPFPLGKPVTTGSRKTSKGTEYLFKAKQSYGVDDPGSTFTVFVTVIEGQKPFFTRVDR